jgi:microcystin-dependent protein
MKISYPAGLTVEQQLERIIKCLNNISTENIADGFGLLPVGAIIKWNNTITPIPPGFHLCNGETINGFVTDDLRDKFVIGAGSTYVCAATGGAATVTLDANTIPAHDHGASGSHYHQVYSRAVGGGITLENINYIGPYNNSALAQGVLANAITDTAANHTHSSIGGGQPHNNLPPYYALCFIQFVGY